MEHGTNIGGSFGEKAILYKVIVNFRFERAKRVIIILRVSASNGIAW